MTTRHIYDYSQHRPTALKLSKYTIPVFFAATLFGKLSEIIIIYICVFLHELTHLYTCMLFKTKTSHMSLHPYGMELHLEELTAPKQQILISLSGPVVNLILFFIGKIILAYTFNYYVSFFTKSNFFLFLFNMIPCTPLDGGEILRSCISIKKGIIYSYTAICKLSSKMFFVLLISACILMFYCNNISLLILLPAVKQGIISKQNEQLLAAKKVAEGEIISYPRPNVIVSDPCTPAFTYFKKISFNYTLIIVRNQKPPVTQEMLISALKNNPSIKVDDIHADSPKITTQKQSPQKSIVDNDLYRLY